MGYRRFLIISCGLFLLVLQNVSPVWANPRIANALTKRAQELIQQGKYQEGAHELARALLIQMDHFAARQSLLALKANDRVPEEIRSQIIAYAQTWTVLQQQQTDVDMLLDQRAALIKELLEKNVPKRRLRERLNYWEDQADQEIEQLQRLTQKQFETEKDPLVLLNDTMTAEKQKKFQKISYLEQQNDDLQNLDHVLASEGLTPDKPKMAFVNTAEFYNYRGEPTYTTSTKPLIRFKDFEDIKAVIEALLKQNDKLQQRIFEQDTKMDSLSKQIVDLSLQISENDMAQERQQEQTSPLLADAGSEEWKSRFELSEEIIKKKDQQIIGLEQELARQKERSQQNETVMNNKLVQKESMIEALGEEIFALNMKVERLRSQRLVMTKKQMRKIAGKKMDRLQEQLSLKRGKVAELEGVLGLYKDLLADATKMSKSKDALLAEKDQMVGNLRGDISRLQADAVRKDTILDGQLETLKDLQAQVRSMQNKVYALEDSKDTNYFASPGLKQQVIELKAQLNDLNQFIEKKLQQDYWPNLN